MNFSALLEIGTMYGHEYDYMWNGIEIDSRVDIPTLEFETIRRCAQSTPLVNTYNGFKQLSDTFFKKWSYQITKLLNTQEFDYNPIWNRDGTTTHTLTSERAKDRNMGDDFVETNSEDNTGTTENTVSAFDSSSYQPNDKTSDSSHTGRNTGSNRDITEKENEGYGENYKEVSQGNIGVTSTQSLIEEERKLYEFNIYDWIVSKYEDELFLKVW